MSELDLTRAGGFVIHTIAVMFLVLAIVMLYVNVRIMKSIREKDIELAKEFREKMRIIRESLEGEPTDEWNRVECGTARARDWGGLRGSGDTSSVGSGEGGEG